MAINFSNAYIEDAAKNSKQAVNETVRAIHRGRLSQGKRLTDMLDSAARIEMNNGVRMKLVKIDEAPIGITPFDIDMEDYLNSTLTSIRENYVTSQNELIKEGLRRKGLAFPNDEELKKFIADNCNIVEDERTPHLKLFCIDTTPFLKWEMPRIPQINLKSTEREVSVESMFGTYTFI